MKDITLPQAHYNEDYQLWNVNNCKLKEFLLSAQTISGIPSACIFHNPNKMVVW